MIAIESLNIFDSLYSSITQITSSLQKEFSEIAPFQVGEWHLRSVIVLVGIVASLSLLAISVIKTSITLELLSLITTAVLCLSLYYVSLYEVQKHFGTLLTEMNGEISQLKEENERSQAICITLQRANDQLEAQVVTQAALLGEQRSLVDKHAQEIDRQQSINDEITTSYQSLLEEYKELKSIANEFSPKLNERIENLRQLDISITEKHRQLSIKHNQLSEITQKLQKTQAELKLLPPEIDRLTAVRRSLTEDVTELNSQISKLAQMINDGKTAHQENASELNHLLQRITAASFSQSPNNSTKEC